MIGYGKMGKAIEKIALERGHTIVLVIENRNSKKTELLSQYNIDAVIEFTSPESAVRNILTCFTNNIPVVCGTTGWQNDLEFIKEKCLNDNQSLIYASNFSIGVNLFFEINRMTAGIMNKWKDWSPSVEEIHHAAKKDAPSGTAITISNDLISRLDSFDSWELIDKQNESKKGAIGITSERTGDVPGTHTVSYSSENDMIEITHKAFNRNGFATGAVIAAEWIIDKKGFYTMRDVLGFDNSKNHQ